MPTREDMNSVGQPFLALRREPNKAVTPDAWLHAEQAMRIAELEAAMLSRGQRIAELETVASEWQVVAEDRRIQLDAARRRIGELERDARNVRDILNNLRRAELDLAAAAIKPDEPMTAAEVRAGQAVAMLRPASPTLAAHLKAMREVGRAWDGLLEVAADEPTSPPEPVFDVLLFEPVAAPAVPKAKIGHLKVTADMWERIGGVGRYACQRAMDVFGATHRKPMSLCDYPRDGAVTLAEGAHVITCRRIPIWNGGRDTYQWLAVVESAGDRELVRRLGGEWWA